MQSVKAQPSAQELSKKRKEDLGRENMSVLCLPFGPRASFAPDKIVQTPGLVMMLYADLTYRQVFLDGRPLPTDPNPTWMGYWRATTTEAGWTTMAILTPKTCALRSDSGGPISDIWKSKKHWTIRKPWRRSG
jgi:hypothetical protein